MRRAWLMLACGALLMSAGCDRSACAGVGGTCLALNVVGDGLAQPDAKVDQIFVDVAGQRTESQSAATALPVTLAISFEEGGGPYALQVNAYLAEQLVGTGMGTVLIATGQELDEEVSLSPVAAQ